MKKHPQSCFDPQVDTTIEEKKFENIDSTLFQDQKNELYLNHHNPAQKQREYPPIKQEQTTKKQLLFLQETTHTKTHLPLRPKEPKAYSSTINHKQSVYLGARSKRVRHQPGMTHQMYQRRTKQISMDVLIDELRYFFDMKKNSKTDYQASQVFYHDIAEKTFISRIHCQLVKDIVHEERPQIDYHFTRAKDFKDILKDCFNLVFNSGTKEKKVLIITGWGKGSQGEPMLTKILKNYCVKLKGKKMIVFKQSADKGSILVTFLKQ